MAGGKGDTLRLFTPFEASRRGDVLESGALRQVREAAPTQRGFPVLFSFVFSHLYYRGASQSPPTSHLDLGSDCALMGVGVGVQGYRWDEGRSGLGQLVALVLVCLCAWVPGLSCGHPPAEVLLDLAQEPESTQRI